MKKLLPVILTGIFALGSVIMIFRLYYQIKSEQELVKKISIQEEKIKEKLVLLANIQKVHYKEKAKYLGSWLDFNKYIYSGEIVLTERRDSIAELYFGKDTTYYFYDTVKVISVKDSLITGSGFEIKNIGFVPDFDNPREFTLYTGYAEGRSVFEIRDPAPVNRKRTSGELDTLMIGSRLAPTTEGNWN